MLDAGFAVTTYVTPAEEGLTAGAARAARPPTARRGPGPARERGGVQVKRWKVQKFFGDLVYDLRSRNLLPVVIMLVVAIVAVPFLISSGSDRGDSDSSGRARRAPPRSRARGPERRGRLPPWSPQLQAAAQ